MRGLGLKWTLFFFFILVNCFQVLPAAQLQFFPRVLCVLMPLVNLGRENLLQKKKNQTKTGNLRGACQKPEVSDDEWCKSVMQEAGIYFSLF